MKCDKCGAWSEVLETREDAKHGVIRRRRQCANGHNFTTYEIRSQAWPAAKHRSLEKKRAVERNGPRWARDQKIRGLLAQGKSQSVVARELGVTRDIVYRVKTKGT